MLLSNDGIIYGVLYRYDDWDDNGNSKKDAMWYADKTEAKETYGWMKLANDQGAQPRRGALIRIEIIDTFGYDDQE